MVEEEHGGPGAASEAPRDLMPPAKSTHASCSRQQTMSLADGDDNAGDLSELVRARTSSGAARRNAEAGGAMSSSMLSAIGSSIYGFVRIRPCRRRSDSLGPPCPVRRRRCPRREVHRGGRDEDGNGDGVREEDGESDWSGMVTILEFSSGM
uniref:Uncharacterized protein n=1 Tax=Oryza glaberrima TaxID=4538 RepID=I1NK79_ORYGL